MVLLGFAIRLQFRRHGYAANFNRAATEKSLPPFLNIGGRQLDNGSKAKIDFYDNLIF